MYDLAKNYLGKNIFGKECQMEITVKFKLIENVSKNGKPYVQGVFIYPNGYQMTVFLNTEQTFILKALMQQAEAQQTRR